MIDVRDVHKTYRSGSRSVDALRGVSCRIERGRFAFIVGPSGSGKSTLLYLMGSLDRPDSGQIVVEGRDLVTMSEAEQNAYRRDQVGFIFQSFNLISNLTALENVLIPFLPRGVTSEQRRRAADLLTTVGLDDRIDHRPYQLSGGEQQRVAIARALVKQPVLILADEPTGELDSKTGDEIYTILRRLQESSGTTLVVVTHDRRFITPDDLLLEIQDGQLANGHESAAVDFSSASSCAQTASSIDIRLMTGGAALKLQVVLSSSEDGVAVCTPSMPGCWSQGETDEKALANIAGAIRESLEVEIEPEERGEVSEVAGAISSGLHVHRAQLRKTGTGSRP